ERARVAERVGIEVHQLGRHVVAVRSAVPADVGRLSLQVHRAFSRAASYDAAGALATTPRVRYRMPPCRRARVTTQGAGSRTTRPVTPRRLSRSSPTGAR